MEKYKILVENQGFYLPENLWRGIELHNDFCISEMPYFNPILSKKTVLDAMSQFYKDFWEAYEWYKFYADRENKPLYQHEILGYKRLDNLLVYFHYFYPIVLINGYLELPKYQYQCYKIEITEMTKNFREWRKTQK